MSGRTTCGYHMLLLQNSILFASVFSRTEMKCNSCQGGKILLEVGGGGGVLMMSENTLAGENICDHTFAMQVNATAFYHT